MVHALLVGIAIVGQGQVLSDPELEKPITVRADAEPIHVLVSRIAEQTGVKLIADPSVGEDRIILFAKNLPAKEVLQKISDHLEFEWRVTKDGIQLWQTPAQKGAEQRALNEFILVPMRRWRQESIDAVKSQRGPATAEQTKQIRSFVDRFTDQYDKYDEEYYGPPEKRKVWSEKQRQLEVEVQTLARQVAPQWQLFDSVVSGLSDQDLLQLESKGKRTVAYDAKGRQFPMSAHSRRLAENLVNGLIRRQQQTSGESAVNRYFEVDLYGEGSPQDTKNVRLEFKVRDLPVMDSRILPIEPTVLSVVDKNFRKIAEDSIYDQTESRRRETVKTEASPATEQTKDVLDEPLKVSDELKAAMDGSLQTKINEQFLQIGGEVFRSRASAIALNEIASCANVNFISDCNEFNRYESLRPFPLSTPRAAFQAMARSNRENFAFEKGWATFRDPNPAAGRAHSVPSKNLLAFRDAVLKPFSLESGAEAIHNLSDRHLLNSHIQNLIFSEWGLSIRGNRGFTPVLRFWATMSAGAKRALLSGKVTSLASLGKPSLTYLWDYLSDRDRSHLGGMDFGEHVDGNDAQWMKENWPSDEDFLSDGDLDERFPGGPPSSASISLRRSTGIALNVQSRSRDWNMKLSAHSAIGSGYFNLEKDEFKFQMMPEDRAMFTIDLAPGLRKGLAFRTFGKSGEKVYEKIADLPEDFRKKMELDYRARRGG